MAQITKTMNIDEALSLLDDDQLIDYILDTKEKEAQTANRRKVLTKVRLNYWTNISVLLKELRNNKLLTSDERKHLRKWLVSDQYDLAIKLAKQKSEQAFNDQDKGLFVRLSEAIINLSHT